MGIQASRKNQENNKTLHQDSNSVQRFGKLEDLEGPDMDSYDKLLAWFVQMAEQDRCDIDKSVMYSEIKSACTKAKEKRLAMRQHSTSIDSYTSTDIQPICRSTKSSEDFPDKSRLTVPTISRQTTFSDEDDIGSNSVSRLLVPAIGVQSSFSDEEDIVDGKTTSSFPFYYESEKEDGFRTVDPHETLLKRRRDFQRCGKIKNIISTSVGELVDRPNQLQSDSRKKSASIAVVRQPTFEKESNAFEINYNSPFEEPEEKVLNDQLLDGNIQDILLSVEVLFNDK